MKKNFYRYLFSLTLILVLVTTLSCLLLTACGDNPPPVNNRIGYEGTYKFAGFKIYKSDTYAGNFEEYNGDEDDAFNELVREFSKEYALEEANKQYFEYNVDGTAVWHLSTYTSTNPSPAQSINGVWDIEILDNNTPYKTETFNAGSAYWTSEPCEFSNKTIEKTLSLYSNFHHRAAYQFTGEVFSETENAYVVSNNYWEIHAVYKLVQE